MTYRTSHSGYAIAGALWALSVQSAAAAEAYVRVVDVGAGLCVIARTPAGGTMVYDAGPPGDRCRDAVRELVPERRIDLLVLSHSDADHVGGAEAILAENEVLQILHPGDERDLTTASGAPNTLARARAAIEAEQGASVTSLAEFDVDPGFVFDLGAADATLIVGWNDGHESEATGEPRLSGGPLHNGLSIVVRYEYGGHAILLTGDTVGRRDDSPASTCQYAEVRMVEQAANVPIASEVLIGQHHGADSASSGCFIAAVDPTYVVFSAGSNATYRHPRTTTARRFLQAGVDKDNIFRTDRGDHEGGKEWIYGALAGCNDPAGDDDVEIWLPDRASEPIRIGYRYALRRCDSRPD
jgi:competence protein ComEC